MAGRWAGGRGARLRLRGRRAVGDSSAARRPLFGVEFNQVDPRLADVFACVGGNLVCVPGPPSH